MPIGLTFKNQKKQEIKNGNTINVNSSDEMLKLLVEVNFSLGKVVSDVENIKKSIDELKITDKKFFKKIDEINKKLNEKKL